MNCYVESADPRPSSREILAKNYVEGERSISIDIILVNGLSLLALSSFLEPIRRANAEAGRAIFRWRMRSWGAAPVKSANGILLMVDGQVDDGQPADITFVCATEDPEVNLPSGLSDHVRMLWRRGKIVGGICAGTYALEHIAFNRFGIRRP